MRKLPITFISTFTVLLIACTSNDRREREPIIVDAESPFFDYQVWGEEETGFITVRLQFRHGGPNGNTILLQAPSKVFLDGQELLPDSARMNGTYYEVITPIAEFAGDHSVLFVSPAGKEYKEEFSFQPIELKTAVPARLSRGELLLELEGLSDTGVVRVSMTDTTAFSEGIARTDTVIGGKLVIPGYRLDRLANGPIFFELFQEEEKRLKNGTKRGGRLSVSYGLRREFELAEVER